jgi:hypothetical protein
MLGQVRLHLEGLQAGFWDLQNLDIGTHISQDGVLSCQEYDREQSYILGTPNTSQRRWWRFEKSGNVISSIQQILCSVSSVLLDS